MANEYRDLTKDDVLQDEDQFDFEHPAYRVVPVGWIGMNVVEFNGRRFRRPLTLAEITAVERVKYESWLLSHCSDGYREKYLKESVEPKYEDGEYQDEDVQLSWKTWCAAVGIDPTADLNRGR